MKRAHDLIFPALAKTWFPWKEDFFRAGCDNEPFISLVGAKGTAKTASMASYSLLWLWADPGNRVVLACTTTIESMNDRYFRYIRTYRAMARQSAPEMPGQIVNMPKPGMYFGEKEERVSGIVAKAIKQGSAEAIAGEFIGIHYEGGVLLLVDEGQKLPRNATAGLNEAIANLSKKGKLQTICAGNPQDRFNFHAHLSEPLDRSFDDLDPEIDQYWRTRVGGVCLRFDGHRSPAIQDPRRFHFLTGQADIEADRRRMGEKHPNYMTYIRGFWPKISGAQTVLNETLVQKFGVRERHSDRAEWLITIAGCDPAFTEGGDEAILQFADLWREPNGRIVLDFGGEENTISVAIDAQARDPEFYQVAYFCRDECARRRVTPDCFAAETTGTGLGFGAILEKEWHQDIMQVSFSERPTEEYTGYDLKTRSRDMYDRRVTELWFQVLAYTNANKIRGMAEIAIGEYCTRQYEIQKGRYKLETKKAYKLRTSGDESVSGSPDRADAVAVVIELAKVRFNFNIEDDIFDDYEMRRFEQPQTYIDNTPSAWKTPRIGK